MTVVPAAHGAVGLATAGRDATVRLWDPWTGGPVGTPVTCPDVYLHAVVAVSRADGRTLVAAGGTDRTVSFLDPTTGALVHGPLDGHTERVWAAATVTLPDGTALVATASTDHTLRLWDPDAGGEHGRLHLPGSAVAVCPLPGGGLAVGYGAEVAVFALT